MHKTILAARTHEAIERIRDASGVDLATLPKGPDVAHRQLFQLEAIADHLEEAAEGETDVDTILERIDGVEGVGPATMEKIRAAVEGDQADG